jgi:hypothetical protein
MFSVCVIFPTVNSPLVHLIVNIPPAPLLSRPVDYNTKNIGKQKKNYVHLN